MSQALIQRIAAASKPLEPLPTSQAPQLQELAGISVILFDIYGTLLISASGDVGTLLGDEASQPMAETVRTVFSDKEEWAIPDADALTTRIRAAHAAAKGKGVEYPEVDIRDIWRDVLQTTGLKNPSRELCERVALEYELRVNPVWPMPGLEAILMEVGQRQLRLGIVSNAQFYTPLLFPALTKKTLEEWGFDADLCVWSWQCLEAKPSTGLFAKALDRLTDQGIAASHVLYVGNDMRNDIWPAATSGCRTALFAGDARSLRLREEDPRVKDAKPDLIVTHLSQLLNCILP